MESVTFDTLAAAKTLERAGFDDTQAEATVKTINKAVNESVATKADLKVLELSMTIKLGAMLFATALFILGVGKFLFS